MTLSIIFLTLAVLFVLFKVLEEKILSVIRWQKKAEERISTVESRMLKVEDLEFKHEAKHSRVVSFIKRLRRDVNAVLRDVGWSDDLHKTQTVEKPKDPEQPNDDGSA